MTHAKTDANGYLSKRESWNSLFVETRIGPRMNPHSIALLAVMALSFVGVVGDILLKKASQHESWFSNSYFVLGFIVYSSTAFGWIFAMKYLNMATVGVVYSVTTIMCLALAGALLFNERLTSSEYVGILLAIGSLFMLSRHA